MCFSGDVEYYVYNVSNLIYLLILIYVFIGFYLSPLCTSFSGVIVRQKGVLELKARRSQTNVSEQTQT